MKQLVELQELYAEFESAGYEVMMIFREDIDGGVGMRGVVDMGKITYPVMLDLSGAKTAAYSRDGYDTYLIGREGVVRGKLDGVKTKRPHGREILAKAKEVGP